MAGLCSRGGRVSAMIFKYAPENTNPYVKDQGLAWFQHNHFTPHSRLINKEAALYFISLRFNY